MKKIQQPYRRANQMLFESKEKQDEMTNKIDNLSHILKISKSEIYKLAMNNLYAEVTKK